MDRIATRSGASSSSEIMPSTTEPRFDPTHRPQHKVQPAAIRVGDLMAVVQYAAVVHVADGGCRLGLRDVDTGVAWERYGDVLVERMQSADRYAEVIPTNQSNVIDVLVASFNRPLAVAWVKKDGEERILRGRFIGEEPRRGYSWCEDLDIPADDKRGRLRQVDHRTILWLQVGGVRYEVK
jgi:hypothetical protein